jgi:hypothetical protein
MLRTSVSSIDVAPCFKPGLDEVAPLPSWRKDDLARHSPWSAHVPLRPSPVDLRRLDLCRDGVQYPKAPVPTGADLSWEIMKPLDAGTKCSEVGEALAVWEAENGTRYQELAAKITTLRGSDAYNYGRVKSRFESVALRCVEPRA